MVDRRIPSREQTDASLRQERAEVDDELTARSGRVECEADDVLRKAREQADETLSAAVAKADAKLVRAGASSRVLDASHAERAMDEIALAGERRTADLQLDEERAQRHGASAMGLPADRVRTDSHLALERARVDEGVMSLLADLADAVQRRDEFLSLASHELRTPLTPLKLSLGLLARDVETVPDSPFVDRVRTYVVAATRQVARLTSIVESLLDTSTLATPRERPRNLMSVDLGEIVREVAERLRNVAEKAGCSLDVEVTSITGRWDEVRLTQAVASLVENAIKYGAGSRIHVRLEASPGAARLTVEDHGIGIAREHLARIFERFERAVPPGHYGGLGLGLHLCRANVEAMGGEVSVASEPGAGSTFTVDLPVAGPDASCETDRSDLPVQARAASPESARTDRMEQHGLR